MSRFMTTPRHLHMAVVYCIIRYQIWTPTCGLFFLIGNPLSLKPYSDVNWASCPDTRRSTTIWYMYLGDRLISWKCKKQDKVSKSSTEAKYLAMSIAWFKILWLCNFLSDIGFSTEGATPSMQIILVQFTLQAIWYFTSTLNVRSQLFLTIFMLVLQVCVILWVIRGFRCLIIGVHSGFGRSLGF